jgi:tungstate transport system substrate-binding protein
MKRWLWVFGSVLVLCFSTVSLLYGENSKQVILLTTTSFVDTGLADEIKVRFEKETGYNLKIIALGTGQALAMAERGEGDVVLAHAPKLEEEMVKKGVVVNRHRVMHNDFVVVGPKDDPAGIKNSPNIEAVMKRIAESGATFVSRGDDSGTHKKELQLWKLASVNPKELKAYIEAGTGMGKTLLIASEKHAYTISDRATFFSFKDKIDLTLLFQNDPKLLNIYHVMMVNPDRYPKVNAEGAKRFIEFLISEDVQKFIGEYKKDVYGQSIFFPDAIKQ